MKDILYYNCHRFGPLKYRTQYVVIGENINKVIKINVKIFKCKMFELSLILFLHQYLKIACVNIELVCDVVRNIPRFADVNRQRHMDHCVTLNL